MSFQVTTFALEQHALFINTLSIETMDIIQKQMAIVISVKENVIMMLIAEQWNVAKVNVVGGKLENATRIGSEYGIGEEDLLS